MAKNESGKPVIGFIVHTKVKQFAVACRKKKTLVRATFLDALDNEIKRIVVLSIEAMDYPAHKTLDTIAVTVPNKQTKERLVCDARIKERVHEARADVLVSKQFLADVNSYAAAMITASMEMVTGAYLGELASGSATATVTNKKSSRMARQTMDAAMPDLLAAAVDPVDDADKYTFEPALPREYVDVTCDIHIQDAVLHVINFCIFTGKTTEQLQKTITAMATRAFSLIGIKDFVTVDIINVTRQKERFSGKTK